MFCCSFITMNNRNNSNFNTKQFNTKNCLFKSILNRKRMDDILVKDCITMLEFYKSAIDAFKRHKFDNIVMSKFMLEIDLFVAKEEVAKWNTLTDYKDIEIVIKYINGRYIGMRSMLASKGSYAEKLQKMIEEFMDNPNNGFSSVQVLVPQNTPASSISWDGSLKSFSAEGHEPISPISETGSLSDGIAKFMKAQTGPASKDLLTVTEIEDYLKVQETTVVGFFGKETDLKTVFLKYADPK